VAATQEDDYFVCPNCGAELKIDAEFCRECGASEDSGWGEGNAGWDDDQAGEDEFDYDDFVRREFPEHSVPAADTGSKRWIVGIVVLLLCLALVAIQVLY
jgi:uncharacterized membrane protein YvbJ